jgi:hypothetical protein
MADEIDGADEQGTEQGEMFPSRTLKTLVKAGQAVETTVALSRAEIPLRNGLPDPDKPTRALVMGVFQSAKTLARREDDGNPMKVTGWKLTANLRVDYVEAIPADDAGLITQRFRTMLEVEPGAAGRLLEQLQALASEALTVA